MTLYFFLLSDSFSRLEGPAAVTQTTAWTVGRKEVTKKRQKSSVLWENQVYKEDLERVKPVSSGTSKTPLHHILEKRGRTKEQKEIGSRVKAAYQLPSKKPARKGRRKNSKQGIKWLGVVEGSGWNPRGTSQVTPETEKWPCFGFISTWQCLPAEKMLSLVTTISLSHWGSRILSNDFAGTDLCLNSFWAWRGAFLSFPLSANTPDDPNTT